ncbi:uncharacterized protein LOC103308128 [Acyrthosiphon pisum]|uniref:DDE Tnp4 domain-containing protein n=1 Tax=Acyrthosiphon pisum TaxID=7029 RepID=A0A8R2B2Q1_ACYPI|nr:uncharacterized protein LOC103308128 [Acyrthosiphon pisum]|eukprot:XP_008179142.1 PREDICTED: uncharacterized protein LOC103308128 [Acyrthosiphon pisum]
MVVPTTDDWLHISEVFYNKTQFPNCLEAVDGKHIRLECPPRSGTLYYNYKHFFSLILMAICDANYCFTIIDVGSFGKERDEGGTPQPFVIIGKAFALHTNLLRPFPGRTLNDKRRIFNYRLSRARQNIECTFGILSNKWRVFHTALLVEPDFAVVITKTCCVLHNFVRRRDGYNTEDAQNCEMKDAIEKIGVGNSTSMAKEVRDYFVNYFNEPAHELSWQNKVIG